MNETKTSAVQLDFERILRLPQKELKRALAEELRRRGYTPVARNGFLYVAGKIPVLLTAHMDTVHRQPVQNICYTADKSIAMSPEGIGGDDRCGIYMILNILEQVNCHVLFCEDEEIGCVGARKFTQSNIRPELNYIVEMDRCGSNDAVFYDCDNPEFTKFVCSFKFQKEFGSCSDISQIAPYLGVAAVNISAGYYNEHRLHEHINLPQMERNAQRIMAMVQTPTAWFEYIPCRHVSFWHGGHEKISRWDLETPQDPNERTPMMQVPEEGCVLIGAQPIRSAGRYYIDKKGKVYDYLPALDAAVLTENTKALTAEKSPLRYDAGKAEWLRILPLETAIELLQVG